MNSSAILCVDDEIMILESIKEQLHRNFGDHYVYEGAESVAEAWDIIEDLYSEGVRLLVIISDWLMPGIKGDQFLIDIHQRFPNIVNVMLTGQADTSAIDRARQEANLYACISKPWSEEELVLIISNALG